MEELYGAITRLVADKVGTRMWLIKDMAKYHLRKMNDDNKVVGGGWGLNFTVLLDCSPAEGIENSSTLTFATRRASTTASTIDTRYI